MLNSHLSLENTRVVDQGADGAEGLLGLFEQRTDIALEGHIRRHGERTNTLDILHKYAHDYKLIIVGDASMSPYEIVQPGGSVEHWNEEAGEVWLRRMLETYEKAVWINPVPEDEWEYTQSIAMTHQLMEGRMHPLTLKGLEEAMAYLSK